jgi:hypothetical protein
MMYIYIYIYNYVYLFNYQCTSYHSWDAKDDPAGRSWKVQKHNLLRQGRTVACFSEETIDT